MLEQYRWSAGLEGGPKNFSTVMCLFKLPIFWSKPPFNQMQLSASRMFAGVIVGEFAATIMQLSSLAKVLANIFIFMLIFFVSAEDVVVPDAATMSRRGVCIIEFNPVGILTDIARNVLRLQDV